MPILTHEQIISLTPIERLALIEALENSLEEEDAPVPQSHIEELRQRMETFEEDRNTPLAGKL